MDSTDRKLAGELLRIKAVLLRPDDPFTWASGWHSPIYCDNRRILSDPELRHTMSRVGYERYREKYSLEQFEKRIVSILADA